LRARDNLPVDPERLRAAFPELTPEELGAYADVTRRLLASGPERVGLLRGILDRGREAEAKGDESLTEEETLSLRYLRAVAKMQRPGSRGSRP
jgi:hypothetical protein